jgi:hypothetical protein
MVAGLFAVVATSAFVVEMAINTTQVMKTNQALVDYIFSKYSD